jgi:hypothetical protein
MDEDHGWHFFSDAIVGDMESYERDSQIFIATDSFGVLRYYHDVDGFTGASAMASVWSQMSKTINSITIRDTIQYYGTPVGAFVHHGNAAKSYWNRYTVDSGLISQNVTAAEIDGDGNIWFGTDKGLTIKRGNEWLKYPGGEQASNLNFVADTQNVAISWSSGNGIAPGLGLVNPKVNDIKNDFSGNVWVATDGGVEYFSEVPETFGTNFEAKRVVFITQGSTGDISLPDGVSYTADSEYGSGSGYNGWYCVYNGTGDEVTVTGLEPETEYRVMVIEYTGSAGNEVYVNVAAENNPANFTTDGYDNVVNFNDESIAIYPVPFNEYITIEGVEFSETCRASFYSINGKLQKTVMLQSNVNQIHTADLPKGIYILQVVDNEKRFSCKITK